jgi:hypothetical protein
LQQTPKEGIFDQIDGKTKAPSQEKNAEDTAICFAI